MFITFEGGEGSGKSTQIQRVQQYLESKGYHCLIVREPGATRVGEAIRKILLDCRNGNLVSRAELLLYEAARAQIIDEVIAPALNIGQVVLCDRYYDSTTAYQGYGRNLNRQFIEKLNTFATFDVQPDITFVLDVPVHIGLVRAKRTGQPDRLESEEVSFHQRVRDGFLAIAEKYPQRVRVIDATQNQDKMFKEIICQIDGLTSSLQKGE